MRAYKILNSTTGWTISLDWCSTSFSIHIIHSFSCQVHLCRSGLFLSLSVFHSHSFFQWCGLWFWWSSTLAWKSCSLLNGCEIEGRPRLKALPKSPHPQWDQHTMTWCLHTHTHMMAFLLISSPYSICRRNANALKNFRLQRRFDWFLHPNWFSGFNINSPRLWIHLTLHLLQINTNNIKKYYYKNALFI